MPCRQHKPGGTRSVASAPPYRNAALSTLSIHLLFPSLSSSVSAVGGICAISGKSGGAGFTTEHTERPKAVTEHTESIEACRGPDFSVFSVPRSGFCVFCGETEGRNLPLISQIRASPDTDSHRWEGGAIHVNGRDGARPSRRRIVGEVVRKPTSKTTLRVPVPPRAPC